MTYLPTHAPSPAAPNAAASVSSPGTVSIAIVNESTVLTDAQVQAVLPALATQVSRDFAPIWHRNATLTFYGSAAKASIPAAAWWVVICNDSDTAGALGYHDLSPAGQPMGKVFAKTAIDNNQSWTVTASHELLELLANPYVAEFCFEQSSNTAGTLYPMEVGDPCEADALAYRINGVLVSDFACPAWFDGWRAPNSAKFDFCGHLTQPLQVASGGYVQTFAATGTGFTQTVMPHEVSVPVKTATGSRPALLATPADQRRASAPLTAW